MRALEPGRQVGLRNAERSWVAFRDTECDFRMSAEAGGVNASLLWSSCRLDLTARRIAELQQALRIARF